MNRFKSFFKTSSLLLIITFLVTANVYPSQIQSKYTLRLPLSTAESSDNEPGRGAAGGFITRAEHALIRVWLGENKARREEYRRRDLEAKCVVGGRLLPRDIFGVHAPVDGSRAERRKYDRAELAENGFLPEIYAVPGLSEEVRLKGHWVLIDNVIYVDKDYLDLYGEGIIWHELDELISIRVVAINRGWSFEEMKRWLDEEGDPEEVGTLLDGTHEFAFALPDEDAEPVLDKSQRTADNRPARGAAKDKAAELQRLGGLIEQAQRDVDNPTSSFARKRAAQGSIKEMEKRQRQIEDVARGVSKDKAAELQRLGGLIEQAQRDVDNPTSSFARRRAAQKSIKAMEKRQEELERRISSRPARGAARISSGTARLGSITDEGIEHATLMASAGIAIPENFIEALDRLIELSHKDPMSITVLSESRDEFDGLQGVIPQQNLERWIAEGVEFSILDDDGIRVVSDERVVYADTDNIFDMEGIEIFYVPDTSRDLIEAINSGV